MPRRDPRDSKLSRKLAAAPEWLFVAFAVAAAFTTYFCMYGYRKAFTVGEYKGLELGVFGLVVDLKVALVIGQVFGYAASKIIGIKFNSEMGRGARGTALVICILVSEVSLVCFALLPGAWKVLAIFCSALPLGMVWGLVFSFLEGRRLTDLMGAGLCCSFIVASGVAKSVGAMVMYWGVTEAWMPAVAGLLYFPGFYLAVWMLRRLPHPSEADMELRVERKPMHRAERRAFLLKFAFGIGCLMVVYVAMTVCRDFRDNFQKDMFVERGVTGNPAIFAQTELIVAFAVVSLVGLLFLIKDNRKALLVNHLYGIAGAVILCGSTVAFQSGGLGIVAWMILNGFGLFLAYVPFNCILFDRLVASLGKVATSVFLITMADALGYLGVVAGMLYKNFGQPGSMLNFFETLCYVVSAVIIVALVASWCYFSGKTRTSS
ncbi:MAG: hypothetical protein ACI8XO_000537 [Verrucomicrobiales bacterium]|jgi:hypothetical protein